MLIREAYGIDVGQHASIPSPSSPLPSPCHQILSLPFTKRRTQERGSFTLLFFYYYPVSLLHCTPQVKSCRTVKNRVPFLESNAPILLFLFFCERGQPTNTLTLFRSSSEHSGMPPVPVRVERTRRSIVAFRFVFAFALSVGSSAQGQPGLKGLRAVRTPWLDAAAESPLCPCRGLERRTAQRVRPFALHIYNASVSAVPSWPLGSAFSLFVPPPGETAPKSLGKLDPECRFFSAVSRYIFGVAETATPPFFGDVQGFAGGSQPLRDKSRGERWSHFRTTDASLM